MKRIPLVIALGAMLASLTGFTQQDADEHAAHHSEEQAAAPPSPPEHDHSQGGGKLQENMKKMHGLMVQIVETEDPKLRSELLQQHLHVMRDQLGMMRKMAGMTMTIKGGDGKSDAVDGDGKVDKKDGMTEGKKGG